MRLYAQIRFLRHNRKPNLLHEVDWVSGGTEFLFFFSAQNCLILDYESDDLGHFLASSFVSPVDQTV